MSGDKPSPASIAEIEIMDVLQAQMNPSGPRSSLPLTCSWIRRPVSGVKQSFLSKFVHHHHLRVFPTAYCMSMSHQNQSEEVTTYDESEEKKDLSLPGVRMKRTVNDIPTKAVGEYEINQLMTTESGWDRVKHMYRIKSGTFEDEGLKALNTLWYRTALMGFFFSAMAGSIKHDKVEKSLSRTDAMRKGIVSQVLIPKEILMTALKDTLKLSILTFSFLHLSQTIAAYKNKSSVWEFSLSSAIGFCAIGVTKGAYKCGVFTAGGAVLGTVIGWVVCQVLQSSDLTQESRTMKRMQQRVEEMRLQLEAEE